MRNQFLIFLIIIPSLSFAQDSIPNKKRLNLIRYGGLAAYTGSMIGLNALWYSKTPRENFHFFNDANEWKQIDKIGHSFSTFQVSYTIYKTLGWAGVEQRKRAINSSLISFGILSSIEIFDGFSPSYGASISDLGANAAGSLLFWGQIAAWKEVRLYPKFSFSPSDYRIQNRELLGRNDFEGIFKDYNGQTYWLSVDMDKFMKFPKWLNFCVGYGGSGMVNAQDSQNIEPYRQFYLGIDFDLTSMHTRSKFLNGLIFFANMIKIPAPTLEFSPKGTRAHLLFF